MGLIVCFVQLHVLPEIRPDHRSAAHFLEKGCRYRLDSPRGHALWWRQPKLLIHTGQAAEYVSSGILEETLIHEASHHLMDEAHAQSQEWIQAQQEDDTFYFTIRDGLSHA